MAKKRSKEPSQLFFFLSLLALGLYGLLEGIAFLTENKETAKMLFIFSKGSGFLASFFVYCFASVLDGKNKEPRLFAGIVVGWSIIASLYIIEDLHPSDWGWCVHLYQPIAMITYIFVMLFMSMALYHLYSIISSLRDVTSPRLNNMEWIFAGFFLWLLLAIATNSVIMLTRSKIMPPFTYIQLVPTLIVVYGYLKSVEPEK
ncbi:MAG: hypothetical protein QCI38_07765 [Candidatus Thermoplasmatota archaeon]|nr:hypothetical protein [Candidatus Thermoplasmatota archaeon]